MEKYIKATIILLLFTNIMLAQNIKITGKVIDSETNLALKSTSLVLTNIKDTSKIKGTTSDINGAFSFNKITKGTYNLKITFVGYIPQTIKVNAYKDVVNLGNIKLTLNTILIDDIDINVKMTRVEINGDTTQYNAGAYKTQPNANAEDLVIKMPGITLDNGTIKSQNENIKQVTVDGKPFFGEDPTLALRSLPAEVIDKIQIFDKLSEQSQFSGFDDGNTTKTLNIVTKSGKNSGQFGKVYGGYGTDDRYTSGGYVNYFNDSRRISLIGMSNNINVQNFSSQDLSGLGSSGRRGHGGGGNFMVDQQGGISSTNSIGTNYSESWGEKVKLTSSYFFNNTLNNKTNKLVRDYISKNDISKISNENNNYDNNNNNHRINARIEYTIDSLNSIIISPRVSFQNSNSNNKTIGDYIESGQLINNNYIYSDSKNNGYSLNNGLLYRHRFAKKGRTISFNLNTDLNDNFGESKLVSGDSTFIPTISNNASNQNVNTISNTYTISPSLNYTEPIGEKSLLMFNYSPSYTNGSSEQKQYNYNNTNAAYDILDTSLSGLYDGYYFMHRGGVNYNYRFEKFYVSTGINYQYNELNGNQILPKSANITNSFSTFLPSASFNYRISKGNSLRVNYRAYTSIPSVNQLMDVIDNSNPTMLSSGNPNLKQQYSHSLYTNYSRSNLTKATSYFVYISATYTNNYIGSSVIRADSTILINNQVSLPRGGQYSTLVNLDDNWNVRSFFTFGFPFDIIKCNVNLNTGIQYNTIPGLINGLKNITGSSNYTQGIVFSSNISKNVDFTLSYSAGYNITTNTISKENNNNYFSHTVSAKFNWIIWKGIFVGGDALNYYYKGLSATLDQNFYLVNPYIGMKLFKKQNGELKISAYDILQQNKSISRNVTSSYIEDSQTNLLQRFFLLTFTYNIKNFKGNMPTDDNNRNDYRHDDHNHYGH